MKTFEILVRETRTAIYIVEADYEFRTVSVTEVSRYE